MKLQKKGNNDIVELHHANSYGSDSQQQGLKTIFVNQHPHGLVRQNSYKNTLNQEVQRGNNICPSNIVYFDNNQIKLEKVDNGFLHPSQIPRPNGKQPAKHYSKQDIDQFTQKYNKSESVEFQIKKSQRRRDIVKDIQVTGAKAQVQPQQQRPKSSVPGQQIKQNTRHLQNNSHQQMAAKMQISVGQNQIQLQQSSVPQSAGIKNKDLGAQTAVAGPRKHKLVPQQAASFTMPKQQNSFILQPPQQPTGLTQTQNLIKDNQQIFFEKRNRSRGAPATGTLVINSNGTPIQQPPSGPLSHTASKVQNSPAIMNGNPNGTGKQLIKDFNVTLIQREQQQLLMQNNFNSVHTSNSAMKQRYQNNSQNLVSESKQIASFDQRTNATASPGQFFNNKENFTIQQNSRKLSGTAQQQLNNLITIGIENKNQTLNSLTNLKGPQELAKEQPPIIHTQKQVSAKHSSLQGDNLEMHLLPSTNKYFKRTFRHFFRRRMTQMDRPMIIINFQGVLGDFFKDSGLSMKQDNIMSKQYVASINPPANTPMGTYNQEFCQTHMWVRIGTIDGLKYLSKHFQIVIFSRDTSYEDHGQNISQIAMIQQYLLQNDITIDAIYASSSQQVQQPTDKKKSMKRPNKCGDIWEDYKQIFLDFSLNNDQKVKDKVLFVNSIDLDYNARQEDVKIDPIGYFLIDARSKPARHLVEGLPLSYETKEKEIDLGGGGPLKFNKLAKQEIVTKEMPVTILIPNPRSMYGQQLSFASIAKTIMTLCFLGQKKSKGILNQGDNGLLNQYLNNIRFLQEFDVKVQRDQCLLQYNSEKQNGQSLSSAFATNQPQNANRNNTQQNSQNGQNFPKKAPGVAPSQSRPRSSNSQGNILPTQGPGPSLHEQSPDEISNKETMVIPLTDQLFQNMSWAASFDFVNQQDVQREILGLISVKSNLVWRYFISLLKQRSNIKTLREKRAVELKKLLEKLEQVHNEDGKVKRQQQIQEIYDKLKKVQTNGNPLTSMMARNLKVFLKIYAEVKRKSKIELENFTEALFMDQKMAELEKQNLENRLFVLGVNKPNLFFNTHQRVYEKVQINMSQVAAAAASAASASEKPSTMSRLYDNSLNNNNLTSSVLMPPKSKSNQYTSISSNGENNLNYESSQRSLIEKKLAKNTYGQKKQSSAVISGGSTSASGGNAAQFNSQNSRKKMEKNVATEGSMTRRSNQSSDHQRFPSSSIFT